MASISPISFTFADHEDNVASASSSAHVQNKGKYGGNSLRPFTPPPRSLHMSSKGVGLQNADEIYPVTNNIVKETLLTRLGRASSKNDNDDDLKVTQRYQLESSLRVSDLSYSISRDQSSSICDGSESTNKIGTKNNELSLKQKKAMDNFLAAQVSGDPVAKQQRWRELVEAMKDINFNAASSRGSRSSTGSRGGRSSRGSQKSWSTDEVLGIIRIGGGVVGGDTGSITSGLSSPTASPREYCSANYASIIANASTTTPLRPLSDKNKNGMSGSSIPIFPTLPTSKLNTLHVVVSPLSPNEESCDVPEEQSFPRNNSFTNNNWEKDLCQQAWSSFMLSDYEADVIKDSSNSKRPQNESSDSVIKKFTRTNETSQKVTTPLSKEPNLRPKYEQLKQTPSKSQHSNFPHTNLLSKHSSLHQKDLSDISQTSHRSRKSRREDTLEEQVRNVLQQQFLLNDDVTKAIIPPSSTIPSTKPLSKSMSKSRWVKSGTVESAASAQDILEELRRSPTPSTCHSDRSFKRKAKPPLSISVSRGMSEPGRIENDDAKRTSKREKWRSPTPPSVLAPSARDLRRPDRLHRKSALVLPASNSNVNQDARSDNFVVSEPILSKKIETSISTRQRNRIFPCTSPLVFSEEIKSSTPHLNTLQLTSIKPRNLSNYSEREKQTFIPENHLQSSSSLEPLFAAEDINRMTLTTEKLDAKVSVLAYPSDTARSRPVHPGLAPSIRDVPSLSLSGRRRAVEEMSNTPTNLKEYCADLVTMHHSFPSSAPMDSQKQDDQMLEPSHNFNIPISSTSHSNNVEEIRASIFQLKFNGVGGIGKATSTLVRNEETGRYIIRDVDDASFDDIVLAEMMRPNCTTGKGFDVNQDTVGDVTMNSTTIFKKQTTAESNEETSFGGSVLSDSALNDVQRAAIDDASVATFHDDDSSVVKQVNNHSVTDIPNSTNNVTTFERESSVFKDDFFIVDATSSNKWCAFQSSLKTEGSFLEHSFDIYPSNSADHFGIDGDNDSFVCTQWDSGSDEWRDEQYFQTGSLSDLNDVSPTSVITTNRKSFLNGFSCEEARVDIVQAWDPFDL